MVTVLFLVASPQALGALDPALPIFAEGASTSAGSASTTFTSAGGTIALEIAGEGTGAAGGGVLLDGPTGSVLLTVARIPDRDGVYVDVRGPAAAYIDLTASVETETSFAKGIVFENAPAGEYRLVAFGAGLVDEWSWTARAPAASVLRSDANGVAWLATSRDFAGDSNVQAFQAGAGARVTDGKFAFRAAEGLVGVYYPVHATSVHDSFSASTPAGSRDCTCAWLAPGTPGAYTLHESGVGAGSALLADVVFIGADARFA